MALDVVLNVYAGPHFNGALLQTLECDTLSFDNNQTGGSGKLQARVRYGYEQSFGLGTQFTANLNSGNRIQAYLRNDVITTSISSGAASISVAYPANFKTGQAICLWDGTHQDYALITNISGSTLTLGTNTTHSYSANTGVFVLRYSGILTAINRDATLEYYSNIEAMGYAVELNNYITSLNGGGKECGWTALQLCQLNAGAWDLSCSTSDWVYSTTGAVSGTGGAPLGTGQGYYGTQTTTTIQSILQDIITFANANNNDVAYTFYVDVFGQIHFVAINQTTPTCTVNLLYPEPGYNANGLFNLVGTLQVRDEDITQIANEILVQGGSDGAGNQITAIVTDTLSISAYGTWQQVVSQSGLNTVAAAAAWGQAYLNMYAFPRQTANMVLQVAGSFLTALDYVQVTGFEDGSTVTMNISTVTTTWSAQNVGQFSQTIQGMQIYPNVAKLINQISGQKYQAALAGNAGGTNAVDRFVKDGITPAYIAGTDTFVVSAGHIGCLVANVGLDIFTVPTLSYTPPSDGPWTLAWLYRNNDGTLYSGTGGPQWVEFAGPGTTVAPTSPYTQYQILPLFTIFRLGGQIVSYNDLRQFGGFNLANIQNESYPAPTVSGSPTISLQSVGVSGLSSEVVITATLTNTPQDNGCSQIAWLYKNSSASAWQIEAFTPLSGFPTPSQTQSVSYGYGGLQNGTSYIFGLAYVNFSGQINLTSGVYTFVNSTYPTGVVPCNAVAIGAPYQLGGTSITPTITGASSALQSSPNGINAALAVTWTCTNQPQDGSLSRINVFYQYFGSTTYAFAGSIAANGVGTATPPATGTYGMTLLLTGNSSYNIFCTYENTQGGDSGYATILNNVAAATIVIGSNGLEQMPSLIKTNGPSITVQSAYSGGASTYYSLSGVNGGTDEVQFEITYGDTLTGATATWYSETLLTYRVHGTTNYATFTGANQTPPSTSNVIMTLGGLGAGKIYDIGIAYKDTSGTVSTIVWPTHLQSITAASAGPGAILGSGNQNLVPDSGLDFAPYNSSGIAGSDSGYWHFELIDGTSYYLLRPSANTSNSAAANVMWWAQGASGQNRYGVSNTIYVTPGSTYCFSSTCDASQLSTGSNKPGLIIALPSSPSNTYGTVIATVNQTLGQAGRISSTFTAPSGGEVVIVATSNSCTIPTGKWFNMAQFQIELGSTFTGYKPGTAVLPTGTTTHTAASPQTQATVNATVGTDGSYLASASVSRRSMTDVTSSNILFNPTGATGNTSGWTFADSTGGHTTFSADGTFKGGRFAVSSAYCTSGTSYGIASQRLNTAAANTLYNGYEYTFSGFYEVDGPTWGAIDVLDVNTGTSLGILGPVYSTAGVRVPFSFNFTYNNTSYITARMYVPQNNNATTSTLYAYDLKIEVGAVATPFEDGVSTGLVTNTHQLIAGAEGSFLQSSVNIATRHLYNESLDYLSGTQVSKNLVVNGNNSNSLGQNGSISPSSFGWTGTYGSFTNLVNSGTYTVDGSNMTSMQLNGSLNCGAYQVIPVTPGQTYTFQCLTFTGTASYAPGLWIGGTAGILPGTGSTTTQFNASPGVPTAYSATSNLPPFYAGSTGSTNTWYSNGTAGTWITVYGTFTVPANYTEAVVMLYNSHNGGVATQCYYMGVQVTAGIKLQDYVDHETGANSVMLGYHATNALPFSQHDTEVQNVATGVTNTFTYSASKLTTAASNFILPQGSLIPTSTSFTLTCTPYSSYSSYTTINGNPVYSKIAYSWPTWSITYPNGTSSGTLTTFSGTDYQLGSPGEGGNGLQPSTSYYVSAIAYTSGPSTVTTFFTAGLLNQSEAATVFGDGFYTLLVNQGPITTPARPSSGNPPNTGGGYSPPPPTCPGINQILQTRRGYVMAKDLVLGDELLDWDGTFNKIHKLKRSVSEMYAVRIGREWYEVDKNHLWWSPLGWWPQHSLARGDRVISAEGGTVSIDDVKYLGYGEFVKIGCDRQRFMMGKALAHNMYTGVPE